MASSQEIGFFFELNPNRIGEVGGAEGVDLVVVEGGRSQTFFAFVNAVGGAFVPQLEAGAAQEAQEPPIAAIARHRSVGLTHQGIANHDVAGLGTAAQEVAIAPFPQARSTTQLPIIRDGGSTIDTQAAIDFKPKLSSFSKKNN